MAHINPVFVIATSELAIGNGQDRPSSKFLKGSQPGVPEGSAPVPKSKELRNMIRSKWKWSWVFNGIIVLTLGIVIMVLEFGIIPFRPLGYQCNDPSLSHKFAGDTISFVCVISVSLIFPLIAIFVVEFTATINVPNFRNSMRKRALCLVLYWYGQFFLGLLILLLLVQLSKNVIAEPRPHFFDTCKPDKHNCTGYVTEFVCTNEDLTRRTIRDSYKSFPSGHSALGFYVGIFMTWFFQSRIPNTDYIIAPVLQCMVLSWAVICALTRITDHRHHWWDVVIGSIMGIALAVFSVKVFCKNFRYSTPGKSRKRDRSLRETGSSTNNWYKKTFGKSSSIQPPDDRELREVK